MSAPATTDVVSFKDRATADQAKPHNDLLVIELTIKDIDIARVLVDTGCSANIIYKSTLERMEIDLCAITERPSPIFRLSGNATMTLGSIDLVVKAWSVTKVTEFLVIDRPTSYNAIVGTPWLNSMRAIPSTFHLCLKFPTPRGVETIQGDRRMSQKRKLTLDENPPERDSEVFWQSQRAEALEGKREPTCEPVISICLDKSSLERCVDIGANLCEPLKAELIACLKKNLNAFAWAAEDMPGIDIGITCHELNIDPTYRPVKQKRRKLGPERATAKNGKWRACVDFTDLNKACPKDCFPLPHIDRLVEATAGNKLLSFIDAFSGYNQIMMNPDDREKTAFITDRGTYCYKVMPFGLKNAGATYQRLVNRIFSEQRGKTMEVYIDDMLVNSLDEQDHISHLEECFAKLNAHNMKLNPTKCRFAVASGEFLGYLVTCRGIEANPKQISALIEMVSPRMKREVQRLTGRVAALNRFISRSTDKCLPFYNTLKGNKKFKWSEECEKAFQQLKRYLATPPVLAKPVEGEPLFLYIAVSTTAVSGVLIREERGEQKPIFYISKTLLDAEARYRLMEKLAFAVVISARKLRPYFQSHTIIILTTFPMRTILHSPSQLGRLAKWSIELREYDVEYRPRTCAKSQVLADFLVELPTGNMTNTEPDSTWIPHVDGSSSKQGSGIRIRLTSLTGEVLEQSFRLEFHASNNEAEYEELVTGLRLAHGLKIRNIHAYCDSQLVANQYIGEYEARDERMDAYLKLIQDLSRDFNHFALTRIPRSENTRRMPWPHSHQVRILD
ncbi:uncharacterized protein LOC106442308 [Brassica napus]|uniref:uncharacterized protein LOC106442308 n=1 Tax=Brassica napus TaxID=3708 RepID=UPI0006AAFC91|nr:uncharacterized protein LOC106442308 [Brassica napus]